MKLDKSFQKIKFIIDEDIRVSKRFVVKAERALEDLYNIELYKKHNMTNMTLSQANSCEQSPITICVFAPSDFDRDECVFCSEPETRV